MIGKKRERRERVLIVLDGNKIKYEQNGVSPLIKALQERVGEKDEALVLSIVNVDRSRPSSSTGPRTLDGEFCIKFLQQEIHRRKETYKQILMPYYKTCKDKRIKFEVKIAVGCQPKDLIMEEAKNMKATWIFMDSCFAKGLSLRINSTGCNVSLVFDDETPEQKSLPPNIGSGSLTLDKINDSKKPDIHRRLQLVDDRVSQSLPSIVEETHIESEDIKLLKLPEEIAVGPPKGSIPPTTAPDHTASKKASGTKTVLELPIPLSRELIAKIENQLKRSNNDSNDDNITYTGCLPNGHYSVLVKKFNGDSNGVFEAEKKAAMSMCHRNIQGLIGYHRSDDATFLAFPNAKRGTLAKYLSGTKGKEVELTFSDKVKIATGIAQGLRYMHQECPRGPIVHGNLVPLSIVLGDDFLPQITNFEKATWLHQEQVSPISMNRPSCKPKEPSDHKSLNLVKADILSFGVLLLRLFCHRLAPQDSGLLIKWAKPLVLQRAFHILLGENEKDVDPYELYKVMSAAIQCTRTRPVLRPCMSEVVSLFQGQMFCCIESSPSDTSE